MKITDEELMQAMYHQQLKRISEGVLISFIGGASAVTSDIGIENFYSDSYLCKANRGRLTDKLGSSQLLVRIKKLITDNDLQFRRYKNLYVIKTSQAYDSFIFARGFYISKGIPSWFENGEYKTVHAENLEETKRECLSQLIKFFGVYDKNSPVKETMCVL